MNIISYFKNRIDNYYILREYNNYLKSINKANNKDLLIFNSDDDQSELIKNVNPFYQAS